MAKTNLTLKVNGSEKTILLPKEIFAVVASPKLLSQYVYVYLNNLKQGKGKVKTRSEVTGSTRKIYRQKGTGRARHGDIKAPIFVGGGVALGPTGNYRKLKLTKKMKRKALFFSLSQKTADNHLKIQADNLLAKVAKTKAAQEIITKLKLGNKGKYLLVLPHTSPQRTAFKNLKDLTVLEPAALNAYKVLAASELVFSESALDEFIKLFNKNSQND